MKIISMTMLGLCLVLTGCAQNNPNDTMKSKTESKDLIAISDQDWKEKLTEDQYYVLREKGTERPFTGQFVFTKDKGTYKCAACGNELFTDEMKFESQCGWPSFDKEVAGGKIIQTEDSTHGMKRIEITCARCNSHLGHIFDDGPTETGKRYCVNSLSLQFEPAKGDAETTEQITLGGGCFWCVEAVFEELKGVIKVESGYSGGKTPKPTYKDVCSGTTGHAEVVNITFNPEEISLEELLEVFFTLHDPTTLNRQGADAGTQYRSVIFYHNASQKAIAENAITILNKEKAFESPIVTLVSPFTEFYIAEDYHQEYYQINKEAPYCKMVIKPKMDKLEKIFKERLKK